MLTAIPRVSEKGRTICRNETLAHQTSTLPIRAAESQVVLITKDSNSTLRKPVLGMGSMVAFSIFCVALCRLLPETDSNLIR